MTESHSAAERVAQLLRDFWERALPAVTRRDARLLRARGKADVLIGMRRSGKTYRLFQEISDLVESGVDVRRVLYLNLEDDRLGPIGPPLLSDALETFFRLSPSARDEGAFLFFDEIQRVDGWSRFARRIIDTERVRLVVTGSSSVRHSVPGPDRRVDHSSFSQARSAHRAAHRSDAE